MSYRLLQWINPGSIGTTEMDPFFRSLLRFDTEALHDPKCLKALGTVALPVLSTEVMQDVFLNSTLNPEP